MNSHFKIESFSPNCLMGTLEAISRHRYDLTSINRLFFDYSFQYEKSEKSISFSPQAGILNISFTRELPFQKQEFLRRLEMYYGLVPCYKQYLRFDDVLDDLFKITALGEGVVTEIDLYYVMRHPFYKKCHEGHTMIVTSTTEKAACINVVDSMFGHYAFPLEDYEACFRDVIGRDRPFYLCTAIRRPIQEEPMGKVELLEDLNRTLNNLTCKYSGLGLNALVEFIQDFDRFYENNAKGQKRPFLIPGFWAFMCNSMNNVRFLEEFEIDFFGIAVDQGRKLRKKMSWLNRRWFVLNLAMERSLEEDEFELTRNMQKGLSDILAKEEETLSLIEAFRDAVMEECPL